MGSEKTATRRRYGADTKARVLAECGVAGASVAKVAMAHGINANVVHRWRQLARESEVPVKAVNTEFVPVVLPDPAPAPPVLALEPVPPPEPEPPELPLPREPLSPLPPPPPPCAIAPPRAVNAATATSAAFMRLVFI